jgi:ABC-2 type transport system permease protein
MRTVWIIAVREFKKYFVSPLAYAVAIMIYLILGLIFAFNLIFGLETGQIPPNGNWILQPLAFIMIFAVPALTMRLLADEQRMGTMELLLTSPVRDWELVVGKWLGSLGFATALLSLTWIYPLIMDRLTDPGIDQGVLLSTYLGLIALFAAMLAVGILFSALFENPFAAFFAALGAMLVLWVIGIAGRGVGIGSEIANYLSLSNHAYDNLFRGIVDISDLVFYISLSAVSLFLGTQVVESRRWR